MPISVSDLCNEVVPRILSPVLAPHRSYILLFGEGYYNSGTQNFPNVASGEMLSTAIFTCQQPEPSPRLSQEPLIAKEAQPSSV